MTTQARNELVITIKTSDAEELTTQLQRALISCVKWYLNCDAGIITKEHKDDLTVLMKLHKALLN